MMEAARTSETLVDNYFTRQYIPEDNSEQGKSSLLTGMSQIRHDRVQFVTYVTTQPKHVSCASNCYIHTCTVHVHTGAGVAQSV
jgi:hypothetical protein